MTLRKWQQGYRDRIATLNKEDLFDEMLDAQVADGWDGCFTDHARWHAKESVRQVHDKYTRNAKLAALVTPELAALLEYLAEGIDCLAPAEDGISTPRTDEARTLAAKIREALSEHQAA